MRGFLETYAVVKDWHRVCALQSRAVKGREGELHKAFVQEGESGRMAQAFVDALFCEYEPGFIEEGEEWPGFAGLQPTNTGNARWEGFTRGPTSKLDETYLSLRHLHVREGRAGPDRPERLL